MKILFTSFPQSIIILQENMCVCVNTFVCMHACVHSSPWNIISLEQIIFKYLNVIHIFEMLAIEWNLWSCNVHVNCFRNCCNTCDRTWSHNIAFSYQFLIANIFTIYNYTDKWIVFSLFQLKWFFIQVRFVGFQTT